MKVCEQVSNFPLNRFVLATIVSQACPSYVENIVFGVISVIYVIFKCQHWPQRVFERLVAAYSYQGQLGVFF